MIQVSIIVPCFNEENTIKLMLDALKNQSYPLENLEVIIADGMSTDGTRDVIQLFQNQNPKINITILDNPQQKIPTALNQAINNSVGEIIIRLDAHSVPSSTYVEYCVARLREGKGDNVGGVWIIKPGNKSWIAKSIAEAAANPLGVGDARYRYSDKADYVETVPFGAFFRETLVQIGGYDENLEANEDYELNTRILKGGGKVYFDPDIQCVYFSRNNLQGLSKQYYRYGFWKLRMLRRYPGSLRWRQALPPVFVAGMTGLAFLSIIWEPVRWLFIGFLGVYLLALLLGTIKPVLRNKDATLFIGVPLAITTMHFSWGWGFLRSIVSPDPTRI